MLVASQSLQTKLGNGFDPDPENSVFYSLFKEYERVIFQSVITSFGLDGLIKDRLGGDVDTVLNVRKGDEGGGFKNQSNEAAYKNRGPFKEKDYRDNNKNFRNIKRDARELARENKGVIKDEYTGENLVFSKYAPPGVKAELDHVIPAKAIYDDKGRVLSGLSGSELANSPENLKFTNKSLNASMRADEIPDYIEKHPELPDETKAKMMEHYNNAKKQYEEKINRAYYTSPKFWKNSGLEAGKVGFKMGLRQTLGFVMTEVWFAVKDELATAADNFEAKLKAIAEGIKRGFVRAIDNFRELIRKFGEGAVAGVLSSLSTTFCNIFFTTAKNVVRIIRLTWSSIVEATRILIYNPDHLPFSERMQAALKIIATGASVVLGTMVQDAVHKALLPHIGIIPGFGETLQTIVSVFAGSLCTGFLTVSLLFLIDSDPFSGYLTKAIDEKIADYKRQARLFEEHAAKLKGLDIAKFEEETALYHNLALNIETAKDDRELNRLLKEAMEKIGISIPWGDTSLGAFINDASANLRFEA